MIKPKRRCRESCNSETASDDHAVKRQSGERQASLKPAISSLALETLVEKNTVNKDQGTEFSITKFYLATLWVNIDVCYDSSSR